MELLKDHKLYQELDVEKNDMKTVDKISVKSGKKFYWKCKNKHSWQATAGSRYRGAKCPYCTNRKVLRGFNDLMTTHPEIAKEWDYNKNDLFPYEITSGTNKKYWWLCSENHSYHKGVKYRKNGQNCPYCYGKQTLKGFNDLMTTHPEIAKEWDYNKNCNLTPQEISKGSDRRIWWICKRGHSYDSMISNRVSGRGCRYCAGYTVRIGETDLKTIRPDMMKYWDYDKNHPLLPENFTVSSSKKVWWICDNGHSTYANIYDRTAGKKCPHCNNFISNAETEIFEWLSFYFPKNEIIRNTRKIIVPKEIDIYIPHKKFAIEFNGLYWHSEKIKKDKNSHYDKFIQCSKKQVKLFTVWEDDWNNNQNIIKQMILHELNIETQLVLDENIVICNINQNTAKKFTNNNNIQKFTYGSKYLGMYSENNLIAVSIWEEKKNKIYLKRYSKNRVIPNGLEKFIVNIKNYCYKKNIKEIIAYSDNEISDGDIYKNINFYHNKDIPPDFKCIYKNRRENKSSFLMKAFNDDLLMYNHNMNLNELLDLNNVNKVWDSGKKEWILTI